MHFCNYIILIPEQFVSQILFPGFLASAILIDDSRKGPSRRYPHQSKKTMGPRMLVSEIVEADH